jgi:hypothetical protein
VLSHQVGQHYVALHEAQSAHQLTLAGIAMEYKNLVADFAERTLKNLETLRDVQQTEPQRELFEVTQLVNSMLGLLVFPQQRYVNEIPEVTLTELEAKGWLLPKTVSGFKVPKNLRELFRFLRHSIAHCNVEFIPDRDQQISGIRLWNYEGGRKENGKNWEAELSINQLERLTRRFIRLLTTGEV